MNGIGFIAKYRIRVKMNVEMTTKITDVDNFSIFFHELYQFDQCCGMPKQTTDTMSLYSWIEVRRMLLNGIEWHFYFAHQTMQIQKSYRLH